VARLHKYAGKILLVEDDHGLIMLFETLLRQDNFLVKAVRTAKDAKASIRRSHYDIALLDHILEGTISGLELAHWIKQKIPSIKVIGISSMDTEEDTYRSFGYDFLSKPISRDELRSAIRRALDPASLESRPRAFIVHGHDDQAKSELKDLLRYSFKFQEPIVLHEQPNYSRTIIEKLEEVSKNVDYVFVLLTPDDLISSDGAVRARQNVIFELGYFVGFFKRNSGKVILLYKGALDLPSDLSGLVYINISKGIQEASDDIRKEVAHRFRPIIPETSRADDTPSSSGQESEP
jgi:predicted nucleotide-binding protein